MFVTCNKLRIRDRRGMTCTAFGSERPAISFRPRLRSLLLHSPLVPKVVSVFVSMKKNSSGEGGTRRRTPLDAQRPSPRVLTAKGLQYRRMHMLTCIPNSSHRGSHNLFQFSF